MIPDAEAIVGKYLRQHPSVRALVERRVVSRTPSATDLPWVRVTAVPGIVPAARSLALHLIVAHLQFDCYAGDDRASGQAEASGLSRAVMEALHESPGATTDAVVSHVTIGVCSRIPDPDFEPARERYIVTAAIHMHA